MAEYKVTFSFDAHTQPAWERHIVRTNSDVEQKDLLTFAYVRTGCEQTNVCNCQRRRESMWYDNKFWQRVCQRTNHSTPSKTVSCCVQTKHEFAEHVWRNAFGDHWHAGNELFWGEAQYATRIDTVDQWKHAVLAQPLPLVFYLREKPPKQNPRPESATVATQPDVVPTLLRTVANSLSGLLGSPETKLEDEPQQNKKKKRNPFNRGVTLWCGTCRKRKIKVQREAHAESAWDFYPRDALEHWFVDNPQLNYNTDRKLYHMCGHCRKIKKGKVRLPEFAHEPDLVECDRCGCLGPEAQGKWNTNYGHVEFGPWTLCWDCNGLLHYNK